MLYLKTMFRRILNIFFKIFLLIILISSFIYVMHPKQFTELKMKKMEYERIKNLNESLLRENELLQYQIDLLYRSNNYVEKIAREELGMIKEGEYVLILPPNSL